jgi:hypothetical protein
MAAQIGREEGSGGGMKKVVLKTFLPSAAET